MEIPQKPAPAFVPPPAESFPAEDEVFVAPASFAQARLWFLDRLRPGSPAYNLFTAVRTGGLRPEVFQRALDALVERHESLRTTFATFREEPVQVIALPARVHLPQVDLRSLPSAAREPELARLATAEALRPFDLVRGPLLRVALVRLGADDDADAVLFNLHHIVGDGWSMGVLVREVTALYEAFSRGEPSPLPDLPLQYADFAQAQRDWLRGEVLEERIGWWRQRLAGAEPLELPSDRPRPAVRGFHGRIRAELLPPSLSRALTELGRRRGTSLFVVLLAGLDALLHRHTGSEDVSIGTVIAGRDDLDTEGMIGFFVNTLVLRTDLSGRPSFLELLARCHKVVMDAFAHQEVPFEKLVEELAPRRDPARTPFFDGILVLQNTPGETPGGGASGLSGPTAAKFDWSLNTVEVREGLLLSFEYSTELFDGTTIQRLLAHLRNLLEAAAAGPELPVSTLPMLTEAERHQLAAEWNDTRTDGSAPSVLALFEAWAARTPEAPAVTFSGESLTYGELDRRAGRLAYRLRGLGAGPEARVGLYLARSADLLVGMLGVWKAGAAWVPLDPAYPDVRLALVVEDAFRGLDAPVLVAHRRLHDRLAALPLEGARTIWLEETDGEGEIATDEVAPGDLAYVIYTSGTTGRPKGVLVEHGSLAHTLAGAQTAFGFREGDHMLCVSPFSFDIFLFDALAPLLTGGTTVLLDPGQGLDLQLLAAALGTVTHFDTVPALMRQVVEELQAWPRGFARPRHVFTGGDAVPADLVAGMCEAFPGARVTVLYGPTEATVICASHTVDAAAIEPRSMLGRPLPGALLEVRDRDGQLVPVGIPGELWVGGPGVARGYLHRPGLTAEKFVPLDGRRFYRTGDLARRLPDGSLEFLGRIDHQVKVRGFRIEPAEIEAVLAAEPEVRAAAVLARRAGDGAPRLAAWIVPRQPEDGRLIPALRERLRTRLPDYMVPVDWTLLPELPLTPNGKLDRRALLEALEAGGEAVHDVPYEAPRTPTEELLAGVWSELLGRERVGARDHFFDLGGHSLLATRLVSRLGGLFGTELPLNAVFEAPTLGGLAARVDAALAAGQGGVPAPPIVPAPRTVRSPRIPLSFAQERLWFLDQLEPGRPVYNMPVALRLGGGIEPALLERSLGEVVRRHEALRTTFPAVQGLPYQEIAPPGEIVLPVVDLRGLPAGRRMAEARGRLVEEAVRPFDLVRGPLLRALALRLDDEELALALTLHHIVGDGWSMEVLTAEVTTLYQAFAQGIPSPLPELPVQYADYAVWQRGWLAGEVLARQVEYWKRKLAGVPTVLELPADRPRPAVQSFRGANRPLAFPPELSAALRDLGRRHGATLFMTLLAVFQTLLHRASGQEVVLVGSPIANRNRTEIEGLIGFFVNTLVLAGDLGDDPPFTTLLARVRETVLEAQAHQDLPFEKLVEELDPERSLSHSPLFQVMLTLTQSHRRPSVAALAGEAGTSAVETAPGPAKFDLSLALEERGGRLAGSLEYAVDLFDAPTVARLGEQLQAAFFAVTARPEVRPSELPLLSEAQRQQLLQEWGGPTEAAETPADPRRLHDLIAEQAARTPAAVAVRFRDEELTYGGLEAQSNRLAHLLQGAGAGPEVPVAVFMDRSVEMVVALLGVLKAGAAYVPLDPAYPQDRLAFMLQDCGATILLSQDWLVDRLPVETGVRRVCLDPTFETLEDESDEPLAPPVAPANLAYLIYTSGSTGRPKGVAVTHASAVALLRWAAGVFPDEELAGVLASTSICFDLSVFELFFPLSRGGCVLVVENALEMLTIDSLGGQPVTLLNTVPSAAAELVRAAGLPGSVRTVCLAGEPIPAPLVAQIHAQPGVGRLLNLYGPSEDTTYSTIELAASGLAVSPAIGRPITGTRAYVLDAGMRPVPPGMPGELYLGGTGLARGYFQRPELTAERFVPDPFGEVTGLAGERLYRTGDRVRHLSDGRLDYLGRFDHQVKLRGFRIELGEIEAVLARHPAVRQAVVTVRGSAADRRLVAYLVPAPAEGEETPRVHEIKGYLRDRLPDYMVPPAFVLLPELPLNPSGKVDRRALPDPGMDARMPPRDLVELELARLWEEVLDVHPVGVRDDFFDLGGHSLLAVRLMASIRERFGRELPLASLFRAATVEQLAALLRQGGEPLERRTLVEITAPRPHAAGSAEPALFCVHPAGGNVLCYMELARALGPDQPVYGLQLTDGMAGDVEEMAARYVAAVREVQPRGPYSLGGWSAGGTIAFEMARQLAEAGEEVRLLALIDTPRPGIDGAWKADEIEMMVMFARDLAATYGQELPFLVTAEYLRSIDPEERIPRVLAEARAIHLFPPDLSQTEAERLFGMFRAVQEAVGVYAPRLYPGRAVVFRASEVRPDLDEAFGWGDFARVEVERVEGDHYSILRAPQVEALARLLGSRLGEEGR
jgi:amino acid adenylation domain-containing protein